MPYVNEAWIDRQPPARVELSTAVQLNFQNLGQGLRNYVRELYVDHVRGEAYRIVPDRIPRLNIIQGVEVAQVLADNPVCNEYPVFRLKFN